MDNKNEKTEEIIEIKEESANEKVNADIRPEAATVPTAQPAAQPAVPEKAASWWDKNVTRKFLSIALAVALALNVIISAVVIKLLGPSRGFDKRGSGRPGNEQQFGNRGGRNNMMPPSGNQQPGGQQNQQPNGQQNQQPNGQQDQQSDNQQNQQSDNQQSQQSDNQDSTQEKA